MANTIQIRRGAKASLPTLNQGELALCTDTDELYIGNGVLNLRIGNVVGPSGTVVDGHLVVWDGTTGRFVKDGGAPGTGGGSGDSLSSTGDCTVDIDSDNSGTDAFFKVTKHGGATQLMSLDEAGNLVIAGTLTEAGLTSSGPEPLTTGRILAWLIACS